MHTLLEQLTQRQWLWQGSVLTNTGQQLSSGFAEFDRQLGGWPASGVLVVHSPPAVGELRLLLPLLKQQQQQGLLALINPPHLVQAEPLAAQGIQPEQLLLISGVAESDALWAAEQLLHSGLCSLVLLWQLSLTSKAARRLQLAAEGQHAQLVQLTQQTPTLNLPFALAISLQPQQQGLRLEVLKRRGGFAGQAFSLNWQQEWPELYPVAEVVTSLAVTA
jgi:protein ImuA